MVFKALIKKSWLSFYNQSLSNTKKRIGFTLVMFLIFAVFTTITYFTSTRIFALDEPLPADEVQITVHLVIFSLMLMFNVFQFFTSGLTMITDFYESPDMSYLVSMPVKPAQVLQYKLLAHTINVIKKESFFAFPMILAVGIAYQVGALFYVGLPIIYLLSVAVSSSVGLAVGMIMLKVVSIKHFKRIMIFGQYGLIALIWALFALKLIDYSAILDLLSVKWVSEYALYVIPAYSAASILSFFGTDFSVEIIKPILFFIVGTFVIIAGSSGLANRVFFKGWMRATTIEPKRKQKNNNRARIKHRSKNRHPIWCLVRNHWQSAVINKELFAGSVMMYLMYIASAFTLVKFDFLNVPFRATLLMLSGFMMVHTGTSIPFISSEIMKNPKLEKQQYALFKTLPISSTDYVYGRIIMHWIPSAIIITIGFTIGAVLMEIALWKVFGLLMLQSVLFIGYITQSVSLNIIYYKHFYDSNKWLGNLFLMGFGLVYHFFTFGLILISEAGSLLGWTLVSWINVPIIIGTAGLYWIFQMKVLLNKGIDAWTRTEF